MDEQLIGDIHDFWFGELDGAGMPCADRNALWFGGGAQTDAACRHYEPALKRALAGALDHWIHSDRGLVALIVLLDQFSRNVYRGTPRAFAGDPRALALTHQSIDSARDTRLPAIHRVFVYLPLEHSEDLAAQRQSVRLFDALAADGDPRLVSFARYAKAHRDVIERFGRFPHRNPILGRQSTAAEREYLDKHPGF